MIDINNRTFIYDAFIRGDLLYLISHYFSPHDKPVEVFVNGIKATEIGFNEYEPVRFLFAPAPKTQDVFLEINGDCYPIKVRRVIPHLTNRIAISALFKDDHTRLSGFIDHYRKQGVDDFYLYYNGDESSLSLLQLPTGPGIYYRSWNYTYWSLQNYWKHEAQTAFLTTSRLQYMPDYKWLFLIDLDELLFHKKYEKLSDYLNTVDDNIDVVQVRNHWAKEEGNKIVYSKTPMNWNTRTKCIYRDSYSGFCGIHSPKITDKMLREENLVMLHILDEFTPMCPTKSSDLANVTFDGEFHLK